jgi:glutathione synthase
MKLAFVLDPLDSLKTYKDSSYAIMQEDILWRGGQVIAISNELKLTGNAEAWYEASPATESELTHFDAVVMRKDPPFDMEYVYSTYLLELAQRKGARIFNNPRAIRDNNEKMAIARFPQFTAPTMVTRHEALIRAFLAEHGDIILKPLDGMGGTSVFRLHLTDPNIGVVIETLTHYGRRTIMVQRYIPEIKHGDKRVLIIDGEPVPYCLARIPKEGETRGNLAAGGRGVARPLTEHDRLIATTLGPELAAEGLLLVGLDVIGDYLTEVNVTSPTCFQEITEQSGFNVAGMMLDAIERRVS